MDSCPPGCVAVQTAKFQEKRHDEIIKRMERITENQEQTIKLLADMNNLRNNFDEFRKSASAQHEIMFGLIRQKIDKSDIVSVMVIMAAAFAIIQGLFKWGVP